MVIGGYCLVELWKNEPRRHAGASARRRLNSVMAERQLMQACYCEETARLGREFDRRLDRTNTALRRAAYLKREESRPA